MLYSEIIEQIIIIFIIIKIISCSYANINYSIIWTLVLIIFSLLKLSKIENIYMYIFSIWISSELQETLDEMIYCSWVKTHKTTSVFDLLLFFLIGESNLMGPRIFVYNSNLFKIWEILYKERETITEMIQDFKNEARWEKWKWII